MPFPGLCVIISELYFLGLPSDKLLVYVFVSANQMCRDELESVNKQSEIVVDQGRPRLLASMAVNASVFEGTAEA